MTEGRTPRSALHVQKLRRPPSISALVSAALIPCVICGKLFRPGCGTPKTCSDRCAAELHRQDAAAFEARNAEARKAYHREKYREKLEAMTPEQLAAWREKTNEKARTNYAKRKNK